MTGTTTTSAAQRRLETQYIAGKPGAPVLVLLHEGLGSLGLWQNVPQELASLTGCGVLVYSRYGNGFSEALNEPRAVSYMHTEATLALPQLLDHFDVDDAILIGHSDGASIALIYAAAVRERVRAAVAQAPHVFVEDLSIESIKRAKFAYESGTLRNRMARHHLDVDRTFYGWNDVWLHPDFRSWDIRPLLEDITVPLLLIQGIDDEYGTLAQLDAIRQNARGARVDSLVLADCGHAPHRDRRELTLAAIAGFVSTVSSRAR